MIVIALCLLAARPSSSPTSTIDSYVRGVKSYTDKAHFRTFALVPTTPEKGTWTEFASEEARQKAQDARQEKDGTVFGENAFVYKKGKAIVQVNFSYYSESGDWEQVQVHFYRPDKTLAKVESDLSFIPGDYTEEETMYYDAKGHELAHHKHFFNLETHKPQKIDSPMEFNNPIYKNVSKLPFLDKL
jgi:hypothetical protein